MFLKLTGGNAGAGVLFQPGDVVDWKDKAEAERMVAAGLATVATRDEVAAAEGKLRTYTPPKPRPEDKWPPAQLEKLKTKEA